MSNFWCIAVDFRGLALLSATKGNKSHYQSKVFACNQGAYTDNSADAVDQLVIICGVSEKKFLFFLGKLHISGCRHP